jgi:AcrR family transcriptional regulator
MNGSSDAAVQSTREAILDAADQFLRERPFRDLTVSQVMNMTSVSRPAFYQYFQDRHDIVAALIARIRDVSTASSALWVEGGGGKEGCAETLREYARLIAPHGYVMAAISDASCADEKVEVLWRRGLVQAYVDMVTQMIQLEQSRGLTPQSLDAELTARALCITVVQLAKECFAKPDTPPSVVTAVGETWVAIWCSTLYPDAT